MPDLFRHAHPYTLYDYGNEAEVPGVGFWNKPRVPVHDRQGKVIILKAPGHNAWGSLMQPSVYYPARFYVFRLIERDESYEGPGQRWEAERLADFLVSGTQQERLP